jgi:ATP-dependent RNA helicase SUPV3L1/SUV3
MRRLRENTMLNTEIGKTGEVIVEGHVIGRLDGFTFAPDAAEAGSEAKALQATALKALAGEIEARAEKLSNAPDDQFVLTSDGTIRWTGDAVARLVAAEDALHPRLRIISDERLTGAPRDAVQARLDLWLKTHIEKLLGPLFELSKAEDVTGIARGIAFQLVEALGVLERQKVAAEMKDLDQPSRATLRKYGVRFGAYHIYFPALLKPAARALASLLWVQKQNNVDLSALSGAQHLASSGRTSFAADKVLDRDAYRTLGYRLCGERAVRVDILERLADLIRPALAWREGSLGEKPAGAFDGRGFVVTQAMTSLAGSAGEDFAAILRALGYRMDRRPAPPPAPPAAPETNAAEAVTPTEASVSESTPQDAVSDNIPQQQAVTPAAAEASAAEPAAVVDGAAASDSAAAALDEATPVAAEEAAPSAALLPDVAFAPTSDAVAPAPADPAEAAQEAPAVADLGSEPAASTVEAAAVVTDAPATTDAAEPAMVEVWRPGGRSDERRPRHDRHRHWRQDTKQDGAQPAAAEGETAEGVEKRERHGRGRRDRHKNFSRPDAPGGDTAAKADGAPERESRVGKGRPPRERFHGKGRDRDQDKGRFQGSRKGGGRDGRPEGGPSLRPYASSAPRERERPLDPTSPFAKLAALKEQLAGRKD